MTEDTNLIKRRLLDFAKKRDACSRVVFSKFLSLPEQKLCTMKNVALFGGFDDAERKMAAFYPDFLEAGDIDWNIGFIKTTLTDKSAKSHRDYLGSILSLGVTRELFGDILVSPGCAVIAVEKKIAPYIAENLISVGNSRAVSQIVSLGEFEIPEKKFDRIDSTLASLRLDCVVALLVSKSRRVAAELIASGRVQINYSETANVSQTVSCGDIITVRGFGKFVFDGEDGLSKKGRIKAHFRKYS